MAVVHTAVATIALDIASRLDEPGQRIRHLALVGLPLERIDLWLLSPGLQFLQILLDIRRTKLIWRAKIGTLRFRNLF